MGEGGEDRQGPRGRYTNRPVRYDYAVKAKPGIFGDKERSTVAASENGVTEVGVGDELINNDQITKVDLTGLWMPSIDRKGKVTFHEPGASWLYDTLIEEGLRVGQHDGVGSEDVYRRSQQNALGILTELSAEDAKITCYRLVLPGGITLHYYQLGEVVTDRDKIPFGLASAIEGWMSIRQKLDLDNIKIGSDRVKQIVFFDAKVFRDVTANDPESDSTVINHLKRAVKGGCYSNLGGIIQVDSGYLVGDKEGEWIVAVDMNQWRGLGWHEIC